MALIVTTNDHSLWFLAPFSIDFNSFFLFHSLGNQLEIIIDGNKTELGCLFLGKDDYDRLSALSCSKDTRNKYLGKKIMVSKDTKQYKWEGNEQEPKVIQWISNEFRQSK